MKITFIKPMKCKSAEKEKKWNWENSSEKYIGEFKFDGHRISVIKDSDGARVLSALNKPKNILWLNRLAEHLPIGTYLDGEIRSPVAGHTSSDVSHMMKADPERLVFTAFDILYKGGEDIMKLPWINRRKLLLSVVKDWMTSDAVKETKQRVSCGKVEVTSVEKINHKAYYDKIIAAKGEGIILKDPTSPYKPGSRASAWLKVKGVIDVDVVMVDCLGSPSEWRVKPQRFGEPDDSKDWLDISNPDSLRNAIHCIMSVEKVEYAEAYDILATRQQEDGGSSKVFWISGRHTDPWLAGHVNLRYGMTDTEGMLRVIGCTGICGPKEEMEKFVGKVAEFKSYGPPYPNGNLRHPQFLRWRDDKLASECTFDFRLGETVGA